MRTSVIPTGVKLVGEVEGRGELLVAGIVEGPIALEGALTIEEGGEVRGDVNVTSLLVRGLLVGTASATEAIRVEASAIVVGDARAPRVQIVEGARFRGRVQMTGEAQPAPRRRRSRDGKKERRGELLETAPSRREDAKPTAPKPSSTKPSSRTRAEAIAADERSSATEPARKRRRDRRPPPPTIPGVLRQTARRKDGAPSS